MTGILLDNPDPFNDPAGFHLLLWIKASATSLNVSVLKLFVTQSSQEDRLHQATLCLCKMIPRFIREQLTGAL